MKIVGKFILLLVSIGALYFGLSQINWSKLFELDEKQEKLEKRLGKLVINELENTMTVVRDDSVKQIVDSLFNPLASKNGISRKSYKIIVVEDSQVNAFALPDRHIVLTTGIINFLDSANYLSAILAHEMAHCEKKHVMKSLMVADRDRRERFVTQQIHYTIEAREAEYELLPISVDQGLGVLVCGVGGFRGVVGGGGYPGGWGRCIHG